MKRKFSLVMSAAMILSLIAPMTNALAEDIQTPETATPETVVTEDAASGGTTYYVDSTIGDDSNSGTSPETPWKSLDKVTATTFLPGDTILLKSGSVWNGEWLWPKGSEPQMRLSRSTNTAVMHCLSSMVWALIVA